MSRRRHEAEQDAGRRYYIGQAAQRDARMARLRAENARLREAVALHRQGPWSTAADSYVCYECARPYPCPTVRAAGLNGEEPGCSPTRRTPSDESAQEAPLG